MMTIPVELEGPTLRLEPLSLNHAEELHRRTPVETYRYFLVPPRDESLDALREFIERAIRDPGRMPYAVIQKATGTIVGSSSYVDIRHDHLGLEIGATWYTPEARGTGVNPECKWIMLRHAFDTLGCVRVQLKCDARNEQSRRAIARLGAHYEGTLRKHIRLPDGFVRDTAMYSIVHDEWPGIRERLEQRVLAAAPELACRWPRPVDGSAA